MMARALLLVAVIVAQASCAEAPDASLRPSARDGAATAAAEPSGGLLGSLRPIFRSADARRDARAAARGAVCGDPALQGSAVGAVAGRLRGCGVDSAVSLRAVSGITLSQGAVMDCRTAGALKRWIDGAAKPALADLGGGLKSLRVAAHYNCRTRNNQPGGKISEHGKGRAIDISAFRLQDGTEVSVLQGWNAPTYSRAMRRMHRGACGPFGTVLGPEADRFHRDHFHFDTAQYRSGSYCR